MGRDAWNVYSGRFRECLEWASVAVRSVSVGLVLGEAAPDEFLLHAVGDHTLAEVGGLVDVGPEQSLAVREPAGGIDVRRIMQTCDLPQLRGELLGERAGLAV
jgi:hypothetical protein